MKINHDWKTQQPTKRKLVPVDQVEAAVEAAAHNATAFTIQMFQEQMLIMLNREFGFGRSRCMKALGAIQAQMEEWENNVNQEFDSETFHMNFREKNGHRAELAWTWQKHDEALRPLIDPKIWTPYTERYKGFGGKGAWCDNGDG